MEELRRRLTSAVDRGGAITLDDAILPGWGGRGGPARITGVTIVPPGPGEEPMVVITGTATAFGRTDLPVELTVRPATDPGPGPVPYDFVARFRLPAGWRFAHSFPDLLTTPMPTASSSFPVGQADRAGAADRPVLDWWTYADPAFVVSNAAHRDPVHGVVLAAGVAFVATVEPADLTVRLGRFTTAFPAGSRLVVHGTVQPDGAVTVSTTVPSDHAGGSVVALADLALGPLSLANTTVGLHGRSGGTGPTPGVTVSGDLRCGDLLIHLTGEIPAGLSTVAVTATGFPELTGLSDLAPLVGNDDLLADLAHHLPDPGRIVVDELDVFVDTATLDVEAVTLDVRLPDAGWEVLDGRLRVEQLGAGITVRRPTRSDRSVTATLTGRTTVLGQPLTVAATMPDGFISAELVPTGPLRLSGIMEEFLPGVPPVSDLPVDAVRIGVRPGVSLNLWVLLADGPDPFTITVGSADLTLGRCEAVVDYRADTGVTSAFTGSVSIAGATVGATMAVPGPVRLQAELPARSLQAVVEDLCGPVPWWPDGFDVGFDRAAVVIEQDGADHTLTLTADVDRVGTVSTVVGRTGGRAGFEASLAAADDWRTGPLADLAGMIDRLLALDDLVVTVSSVDQAMTVAAVTVVNGIRLTITGRVTPVGGRFEVHADGELMLAGLIGYLNERLADELDGVALLPETDQVPLDATVSSLTLDVDGDDVDMVVRAGLGDTDISFGLARSARGWRPRLELSGIDLPDDLPVPAGIADLLTDARLRWSPDDGVSVATHLPVHLTPLGDLFALDETYVPIEYRSGQVSFGFRQELIADGDVIDLGPLSIRRLLVGYDAPAAFEVAVGCDLHLEIGDTVTDLRFAGALAVDLMSRDLRLGIALLGAVRNDTAEPWTEPFGLPGLVVGAFELWVGSGVRAVRGAMTAGRSHLDVDVIWDAADPRRTAVHFAGESLTLQELLHGFLGSAAPALPGPLGRSGIRSVALDYAADDFEFAWLTGIRRYRRGLTGHARVNLFGLDAACVLDLEQRHLAGSMEPFTVGSVLAIGARSTPGPVPAWATGFADLGGPFVVLDLGARPSGTMSAEITLFNVLTRSVDATFDDAGLSITLREELSTGVLDWSTDLTLVFDNDGAESRVAVEGSLSASITINPDDLLDRLLGTDVSILPDVDLVDIALHVRAGFEVNARGAGGSLDASLVLWGHPLSFSIDVDVDLDFEEIGRRALTAVEDAAVSLLNFFADIAAAVAAAVEAVVAVIEEVGEAIVAALEDLAEIGRVVAQAFEDFGRAVEALAEAIADEIWSWFGDDRSKRERERQRRLAAARLRRAEAAEIARRAEARRLEEERRLLVLDVMDNLADGAVADPDLAATVQERIDASAVTGRNPFTDTPEWDQATNRAQSNVLWQLALARARERRELRSTYLAALDVAERELATLDGETQRLHAEAILARRRHQQATQRLDAVRRKRDRVRQAFAATARLVADAREGAVKVEVALDEAGALGDRLVADTGALDRAAAPDRLDTELAWTTGELRGELARLEARVDEYRTAARLAADDVDVVTAALADAEETVRRYRACRANLTLARLDAVRRSMTTELTGETGFAAWVEACRQAGGPERVNLSSLRDQAEEILRTLPDRVARADAATDRAVDRFVETWPHPVGPATLDAAVDALTAAGTTHGSVPPGDPFPSVGSWIGAGLDPALAPPRDRGPIPLPSVAAGGPGRAGGPVVVLAPSAPLALALAELHRQPDRSALDRAVAEVAERWGRWRVLSAQLADAELRVAANEALRDKLEQERIRQRVLYSRNLLARFPPGTDLAIGLEPGSVYEIHEDGKPPRRTTFGLGSTLTGTIIRVDDDHVRIRYVPNAITGIVVARAVYTIPTRSVVTVERWVWGIELARQVQIGLDTLARELSRATAPLRTIQPEVAADARADAELTALAGAEPAALADVGSALHRAVTVHRTGEAATLARSLELTAAATAVDDEGWVAALGPLDTVGVPGAPIVRPDRTATRRRLERAGPVAAALSPSLDATSRVVAWTRAVDGHATAVAAARAALDGLDREWRDLAPDVAGRWRRSTLLAAAVLVARTVGGPARPDLAQDDPRAEVRRRIRDFGASDPGDLVALTAELRAELADKRSRLDTVLDSIRGLALGDGAAIEASVGRLGDTLASAGAALAEVDRGLAEVTADVARHRSGRGQGATVASIGAQQLTVSSTRDVRLLRSVVAGAEAVGSHLADARVELAALELRLQTARQQAERVERDAPRVEAEIDAVLAAYAGVTADVATLNAGLPELMTRILGLIARIRERHKAVVDLHIALTAARLAAAVALDRAEIDRHRIAAVDALLPAPVPGPEPASA
ncbi:MAG: hypothetical protein ACK5PP_07150, partial [Acidimicrobiales bacterium]